MKKLLAMLALSLAMVACGEKQDTTPNCSTSSNC